MVRVLLSKIRGLLRREREDEEFDAEIRDHLDRLEERFVRQGLDRTQAFQAARRQFGGVARVKERHRELRALPLIDLLTRDVQHAFRRLRRSKGFAISSALTLALGVGATIAVFAVLDAVLLRPLPYPEPDRLMAVRSIDRRAPGQPSQLSYPTFFDFRRANGVFDRLVCYRDSRFTLTGALPPIGVIGEIVSWDLFETLGIPLELGRGFRPEEERPGTHAVVLGHALWMSRFGGDPQIVGTAVPINGLPFTVVGVASQSFEFPIDLPAVQLWVTVAEDAGSVNERGARMLDAIGRLKSGVSPDRARAGMDAVAAALARQYPDSNVNVAATLIQPELERLAAAGGTAIWMLFGAVLLLLLIACANVASLLLARSTERADEFAMRAALGASRGALIRQLLVESFALALLGSAAGVLLAESALHVILPLAGGRIPRLATAAIDGRVLAFSAALALLTTVACGLVPAIRAAESARGARSNSGSRIAPGHDRFRGGLVICQIALGLVLLAGAELFIKSFLDVARADPGFQIDRLLTFEVGLPEGQYSGERQVAFSEDLLARLRLIPGVHAAAGGRPLPLQGHEMRAAFAIEGRSVPPADRPRADMAVVTPGFFQAMGVPLVKGRDFDERDDHLAPPVVIVNRAFARKFSLGDGVLGRHIQPGIGPTPARWREIVAVVGDARQVVFGAEPDPVFYVPNKQLPWGIGKIVLRTTVPPYEVEAAARAALAALDRQVPMHDVQSGEELSAAMMSPARLLTMLMTGLAAIALALTLAGLYGVLSYMVTKRRREIGVRMVLGAWYGEIAAMVFRRAIVLLATGLLIGSAAAFAISRALGAAVAISPERMPSMLIMACGLLTITGLGAALLPTARAVSMDPAEVLRSE